MPSSQAEIIREYGPFAGVDEVNGVSCDGRAVWIACGNALKAFDAADGVPLRSIDVAAHAGTAFDGEHLFQLDEDRIHKIDPATGRVLSTIPAPVGGSGLTWAEGTLWMGLYSGRAIRQIDPESGQTLRTVESDRFVTGVTWADGELWHATGNEETSQLRRVDPLTGEILDSLELPAGVAISGIESADGDQFFCGRGSNGTVSVVRRSHPDET